MNPAVAGILGVLALVSVFGYGFLRPSYRSIACTQIITNLLLWVLLLPPRDPGEDNSFIVFVVLLPVVALLVVAIAWLGMAFGRASGRSVTSKRMALTGSVRRWLSVAAWTVYLAGISTFVLGMSSIEVSTFYAVCWIAIYGGLFVIGALRAQFEAVTAPVIIAIVAVAALIVSNPGPGWVAALVLMGTVAGLLVATQVAFGVLYALRDDREVPSSGKRQSGQKAQGGRSSSIAVSSPALSIPGRIAMPAITVAASGRVICSAKS